mmetsp:Transcript_4208/g.9807  ORF Transcript_4208/g.9807 Transcript_4208/m.9807 type:complete len:371 (-) Transcript_4208:71-1183(-)
MQFSQALYCVVAVISAVAEGRDGPAAPLEVDSSTGNLRYRSLQRNAYAGPGPSAIPTSNRSLDESPQSTAAVADHSIALKNNASRTSKSAPPPMMILQRGCTCSSTVMQYARELLPDQGVPIFKTSIKELLRSNNLEKLPWHESGDDLVATVQRGLDQTSQDGLAMIFNTFRMVNVSSRKSLNDVLLEHGTRAVIVHRQNVLDTLVCEVRDCFNGREGADLPRGYPVDLSGKPNDICFLRRGPDGGGIETKAVINVTNMLSHMKKAMSYPREEQEVLKQLGFHDALVVTAEDLLGHEYSASNLPASFAAWSKLLRSFGVTPDEAKLAKFLESRINTYTAPESHRDSIWNLAAVRKEIKKSEMPIQWMLRN